MSIKFECLASPLNSIYLAYNQAVFLRINRKEKDLLSTSFLDFSAVIVCVSRTVGNGNKYLSPTILGKV